MNWKSELVDLLALLATDGGAGVALQCLEDCNAHGATLHAGETAVAHGFGDTPAQALHDLLDAFRGMERNVS